MKNQRKNLQFLSGVLIDFLVDFKRYSETSPKAANLDPFENSRVNRGVRHFQTVLKSIIQAFDK